MTETSKLRTPLRGTGTVAAAAAAAAGAATKSKFRALERQVATLKAQITRLEKERDAERETARRRMTRARGQYENRLTQMVQEIGQLRHHEARAHVLEQALAAKERQARRAAAPAEG